MSYELMDVLWEHLDEAAFLWLQRERSLVAPDYALDEVAIQEERLLAHVDGLVLAGSHATGSLLLPALQAAEVERVAVAAYVLLDVAVPAGPKAVRTALEAAAPEILPAFRRALELRERESLPPWLSALLKHNEPTRLTLALEVLASHDVDPGPELLSKLLRHEEPQVAAAALRAASCLHHPVERNVLRAHLASPVPSLRDAAIEAGLLEGHRAAWAACQAAVDSRASGLRVPVLLLALGGDERDVERLKHLCDEPRHRPDALWALGFSGRLSAAETCLEWMGDEAVSHLAIEAFCAITGLRLEERFVARRAEPQEEDALDADLTPKPEDALPRPEAAEVLAWWKEARRRFERERRYLHGKPFGPEVLCESLLTAPMRRRHALALDIALRSRGKLKVPTRAFTRSQLKALKAVSAAVPSSLSRPFAEGLQA